MGLLGKEDGATKEVVTTLRIKNSKGIRRNKEKELHSETLAVKTSCIGRLTRPGITTVSDLLEP